MVGKVAPEYAPLCIVRRYTISNCLNVVNVVIITAGAIIPFIAGTGKRFFQSALPQEQWTLTSQKVYRNGVVRHIYKACV